MNANVIGALGGISTFFGFLLVLAYLFIAAPIFAARRSVRGVLGESTRFNAKEIVDILAKFETDDARLKALRGLMKEDNLSRAVMARVKNDGVNLDRLVAATGKTNLPRLFVTAIVIIVLGCLAFAYAFRQKVVEQRESVFDCGVLGTFAFDHRKFTVFEASDPGVSSDDAVPYYDGVEFYGFWIYEPSLKEWKRYFLDRRSGQLTMQSLSILPEDRDAILSKVQPYFKNDLANRAHQDVELDTYGHDYVGVIDNSISAFKKIHRAVDGRATSETCHKREPSFF